MNGVNNFNLKPQQFGGANNPFAAKKAGGTQEAQGASAAVQALGQHLRTQQVGGVKPTDALNFKGINQGGGDQLDQFRAHMTKFQGGLNKPAPNEGVGSRLNLRG